MREQDAIRVIPLVSDDGGTTWYPKDGDSTHVVRESDAIRVIRLLSNDGGTTWVPRES